MKVAIAILVVLMAGCASEGPSDVRDAVARRAAPTSRPAAAAIRPMLGDWIVDADATFASNARLPTTRRAALANDLVVNPFELQLTEDGYVSRSSAKVLVDRYDVARVEGEGHVWITLRPRDGEPTRHVELQLGDGRLFLGVDGSPVTIVFQRVGR